MTTESTDPNQARVFILEDHPLVRFAIATLIDAEPDFCVCGEAEDLESAIPIIESEHPDLAVVDITLKSSDGLEATSTIRSRFPNIKVLVFSGHDEESYAARALNAGALGYVKKLESPQKLIVALRHIVKGGVFVSPELQEHLLRSIVTGGQPGGTPRDRLTSRELEIFGLIGKGKNAREIAEQLGISEKTIRAHRCNIKDKLGLNTFADLVRQAVKFVQEEGTRSSSGVKE